MAALLRFGGSPLPDHIAYWFVPTGYLSKSGQVARSNPG